MSIGGPQRPTGGTLIAGAPAPSMPVMTSPTDATRLLLFADGLRPTTGGPAATVRRYRLGRLRLDAAHRPAGEPQYASPGRRPD